MSDFSELLHKLVDLTPFHQESDKLNAHSVIAKEYNENSASADDNSSDEKTDDKTAATRAKGTTTK